MFDQSCAYVIGAARDGGKGQVVNLDVRRKIADVPLPGLPHLASGITWELEGRAVMATPNLKQSIVSVIDMQTWKPVKQIATLGPGFFMRSHDSTPYAWVDAFNSAHRDSVQVIDKRTLEVVTTLTPEPGKTLAHVEFTRDGRYALVSLWEMDGALIVYDAQSLQEVKRIPMRRPVGEVQRVQQDHSFQRHESLATGCQLLERVQTAGQWVFLRIEAGFNAAFGDRLNPFYHLGEIAFLLFWIVAASGLYLYAFFDTGVTEAYSSIERITTGRFHVGLIMRGLHRYASDGMVVTMLLHMLRHFCFDRHRGFRWFSWLSGVLLLWLTYISGINGYMLPWDRLAQFVVVGTAELLDWLPIFNGALVRNFIYQGSVKDRLFSLFSFIHIGVPLTLLLFMWIHIQRVPRASTNPPRAIAVPLLVTLVGLALVPRR